MNDRERGLMVVSMQQADDTLPRYSTIVDMLMMVRQDEFIDVLLMLSLLWCNTLPEFEHERHGFQEKDASTAARKKDFW